MAEEAFGSPIQVPRNGSIAFQRRENVGVRVVRAARALNFEENYSNSIRNEVQQQRGLVDLLNEDRSIVGRGIIDESIKCGMELNEVKLFLSEIAVRVMLVEDNMHWTGELVGERLGQCKGLIIRWKRSLLQSDEGSLPNADADSRRRQCFSFAPAATSQFDFHEEGSNVNQDDISPSTSLESSITIGTTPTTQTSQTSVESVSVVDGLAPQRPRRRYSMENRRRRDRTPQERGEASNVKVTIASVRAAKEKGGCKRNCLREVNEKYILDQRYMAWAQKYEARATWILQMLNVFFTRTEGTRRDKYVTKLDGMVVCNACYATALGYSQMRFKQLKKSQQVYGRVAAVHGNVCKVKESARLSAARECLSAFVNEAGCPQPNRQIRRKEDNTVLPLVLLPMNTTKLDVFNYVNEEVKRIHDGEPLSLSSFRKLWRTEFPHVQIPPFSRFSKCFHCWEYKCGMEATNSTAAKAKIKDLFMVHIRHQIEERRNYWAFKRSSIICPDTYMCLIVDGMDQNTTMVPKMRQTVKNIESRFVKTHLCGVLVHGIGLYADVWIDAHHKHDSNQVITSVMHVLADVRRRKGTLPPTLRIQADNCTRENKNIYMFSLCATSVGMGYFQEVQLCFLIVGHTHEDIDQRFSIISNTLKRTNIDSLKEMLELVEKGTSYTEAFVSARHLENVWNWKEFITPHLLRGRDQLVGITLPHHMRFYMESGQPRVQYKHYTEDAWIPADGHLCLGSVPTKDMKPDFADVCSADERELKALEEFIVYKERCLERTRDLEKELQAIHEAEWLKQYLKEFPSTDRTQELEKPFWPDEEQGNGNEERTSEAVEVNEEDLGEADRSVDRIMATMPNPEVRGYFGPRKDKPSQLLFWNLMKYELVYLFMWQKYWNLGNARGK